MGYETGVEASQEKILMACANYIASKGYAVVSRRHLEELENIAILAARKDRT